MFTRLYWNLCSSYVVVVVTHNYDGTKNVYNKLWHFFQTVGKLCIDYLFSSCEFEIPVRSFVQQSAKFIPKQLIQNKPKRKSLLSFSTFHVTFIEIINVDKNTRRVYGKFLVDVANSAREVATLWRYTNLFITRLITPQNVIAKKEYCRENRT